MKRINMNNHYYSNSSPLFALPEVFLNLLRWYAFIFSCLPYFGVVFVWISELKRMFISSYISYHCYRCHLGRFCRLHPFLFSFLKAQDWYLLCELGLWGTNPIAFYLSHQCFWPFAYKSYWMLAELCDWDHHYCYSVLQSL